MSIPPWTDNKTESRGSPTCKRPDGFHREIGVTASTGLFFCAQNTPASSPPRPLSNPEKRQMQFGMPKIQLDPLFVFHRPKQNMRPARGFDLQPIHRTMKTG
jgi:hypothetical protein